MEASAGEKTLAVNEKTLGVKMPEVTLPDGTKVQTGTIGALIRNIKAYDALFSESGSHDRQKLQELEDRMAAAIPMLHHSGLLDVFPAQDWIIQPSDRNPSPGRIWVGKAIKDSQSTK